MLNLPGGDAQSGAEYSSFFFDLCQWSDLLQNRNPATGLLQFGVFENIHEFHGASERDVYLLENGRKTAMFFPGSAIGIDQTRVVHFYGVAIDSARAIDG